MRRGRIRRIGIAGGALAAGLVTVMAAGPTIPGGEAADLVVAERAGAVVEGSPAGVETPPAMTEIAAATEPAEGVEADAVLETQEGSASYYANMLAGRPTASGIPYDPSAAVAAHRTLPFGTRLRVHNLANGRTVEVEVVDRGPFAKGRILDLSRSAAEALSFIREGHTRVRIEVLEYGS